MAVQTVRVVRLIPKVVMLDVVLLIVLLELGVLGPLPTVLNATLGFNPEPEISPRTFSVVEPLATISQILACLVLRLRPSTVLDTTPPAIVIVHLLDSLEIKPLPS
jgi:hypothetical protein